MGFWAFKNKSSCKLVFQEYATDDCIGLRVFFSYKEAEEWAKEKMKRSIFFDKDKLQIVEIDIVER